MDVLQPCAEQMLSIESSSLLCSLGDRVVSESKKPKTEVKSGFSILKKTPKVVSRAAPGVAVNFARTWNWAWA